MKAINNTNMAKSLNHDTHLHYSAFTINLLSFPDSVTDLSVCLGSKGLVLGIWGDKSSKCNLHIGPRPCVHRGPSSPPKLHCDVSSVWAPFLWKYILSLYTNTVWTQLWSTAFSNITQSRNHFSMYYKLLNTPAQRMWRQTQLTVHECIVRATGLWCWIVQRPSSTTTTLGRITGM